MERGVLTVTLDHLIQALLTGQSYNQQRLGAECERYSLRVSRAKAPDLPDDLHEDISQQAFVELLKLDESALAKHSGRILFRRAVLAAIRSVRASYAPPGVRTRSAKQLNGPKVAAEHVDQIVDAETLERITAVEEDFAYVDFDRLPDSRQEAEFQRADDAIEIDAILDRATPEVAQGLRLIHLDGETVEEAAVAVKLSRFVLSRRITAFCAEWQAAA